MRTIWYLGLIPCVVLFSCAGKEHTHTSAISDQHIKCEQANTTDSLNISFYSELNRNDERYLALLHTLLQPVGDERTDSLNDITILAISRYSDGALSEGLGAYLKEYIKNRPNFISHISGHAGSEKLMSLLFCEIAWENGFDSIADISPSDYIILRDKLLDEIRPYTSENEREKICDYFEEEFRWIAQTD